MPKTYKQLNPNERDILAVLKSKSLREIAAILKRSPSTLSRELKRNTPPIYTGYYLSHKAQGRADRRKRQSHQRQRLKKDFIRRYVEKRLSLGWSPELIAGRLAIDHPGFSISHEAIYQWVYQDATHLILSLVRAHRKRKHRGYSRKHKNLISPRESRSKNVPKPFSGAFTSATGKQTPSAVVKAIRPSKLPWNAKLDTQRWLNLKPKVHEP